MITNNITSSLSLAWAFVLIVAVVLIFLFGQELRDLVLEYLKNAASRRWMALIAFLVGILHVAGYQIILGGTDIVLISIGYLSIVKGLVFLFAPGFVEIFESLIVSRGIILWLLSMVALIAYFMNNYFHFIY